MNFAENQSEQNQHVRPDSSHRRHTNGNTRGKIKPESELDLTNDESYHSIFVTDSSKALQITQENSQDRARMSKNSG